ncbi:unnamed protein product [Arabidopsis lyrata]|nr:unnamed protein product [Arabidopsis lyrata]
MENLPERPERYFKSGEEPDGDMVHKYFQLQYLNDLAEHLKDDEITKIRGLRLGKLFDIGKKFSFSNKFCLFLLTRQLAIQKKHEIWFVYAVKPIRFGLREFASVTGLRCDPISIGKADGKKKVNKNTIKKKTIEAPYWFTLFAKNEEIQEETAEVLRDVDKFLNHPWGRISFDMTMSCIKSREASGLAQTSFAVQGFVHALQLVLLEDVLDIEKSMPVDTPVFVDDDSEEEGVVVSVESIIPLNDVVVGDDFSWSDEVEDVRVDNLVRLVQEGHQWSGDEFGGGVVVSALPVEPKEKAEGKKVVKSKKRKKSPVCASSSDGSQPHGGSPSRLVSRLKGESGAGLVGAKVVAPKAVAPVTKGKVKPPTRAKKAVQPKRKRMRVDGRLRQIRDDDETETATDPVGDESKTAGRKETMEDFRTDSQQREASVTMDDVKTEQRDGDELDDVHPDDTIKSVLDSLNLSGEAKEAAAKSGDGLKEQDSGGESGDGLNDQDAAAKSGDGPKEQDVNDV